MRLMGGGKPCWFFIFWLFLEVSEKSCEKEMYLEVIRIQGSCVLRKVDASCIFFAS
jgi:hypothetical protein